MTIVWRALGAQELDHEQLWLAVAGAGLFGLTLTTAGVVDIQLPQCVFKLATGLPCPTCGTTRAIMALTRLDPATAVAMNPLAIAAVMLGAVYLTYAGAVLLLRLPRLRPRLGARDLVTMRVAVLGAAAANWCYLVLAGR